MANADTFLEIDDHSDDLGFEYAVESEYDDEDYWDTLD